MQEEFDLLKISPSILSTMIMSEGSSVTNRPTESELDEELAELGNWQRFATHLPDLTRGEIIVMFNNRNLSFMQQGYEDVLMHHGKMLC